MWSLKHWATSRVPQEPSLDGKYHPWLMRNSTGVSEDVPSLSPGGAQVQAHSSLPPHPPPTRLGWGALEGDAPQSHPGVDPLCAASRQRMACKGRPLLPLPAPRPGGHFWRDVHRLSPKTPMSTTPAFAKAPEMGRRAPDGSVGMPKPGCRGADSRPSVRSCDPLGCGGRGARQPGILTSAHQALLSTCYINQTRGCRKGEDARRSWSGRGQCKRGPRP